MTEEEGGAFVVIEYPDGTKRTDITRLVNGWVMCCLCFEYKPRTELAPDPRIEGCVTDVCKPCATREAATPGAPHA